jgi:hypothetical protein
MAGRATTTNDHSVAWGVGSDSSGLVGIPVSFFGTAADLTTNTVLPQFSFFRPRATATGCTTSRPSPAPRHPRPRQRALSAFPGSTPMT